MPQIIRISYPYSGDRRTFVCIIIPCICCRVLVHKILFLMYIVVSISGGGRCLRLQDTRKGKSDSIAVVPHNGHFAINVIFTWTQPQDTASIGQKVLTPCIGIYTITYIWIYLGSINNDLSIYIFVICGNLCQELKQCCTNAKTIRKITKIHFLFSSTCTRYFDLHSSRSIHVLLRQEWKPSKHCRRIYIVIDGWWHNETLIKNHP